MEEEPALPWGAARGLPGGVGALMGAAGAYASTRAFPERPLMLFLAGLLAFPGVLFALWRARETPEPAAAAARKTGVTPAESGKTGVTPPQNAAERAARRRETLERRLEEEGRKAVSVGLVLGYCTLTGAVALAPWAAPLLSADLLGVAAQVAVVAAAAAYIMGRSARTEARRKPAAGRRKRS